MKGRIIGNVAEMMEKLSSVDVQTMNGASSRVGSIDWPFLSKLLSHSTTMTISLDLLSA